MVKITCPKLVKMWYSWLSVDCLALKLGSDSQTWL